MKKELIAAVARALLGYGYRVYLADSGRYGFYTDGERVVCFGGHWAWCVDFSGNYISDHSGTGWQIAKEHGVPTKEEADLWIKLNAPTWATRERVKYTTPEKHLSIYGKSSWYEELT